MVSASDAGPPKAPDPFEFLKALWSPMGLPVPGLVAPTLDVSEIDKRLNDLKSVENWLNLNLNVLRMTIQGLEMQKSTLAAMQGMHGGMAAVVRTMQGAGDTAATTTPGGIPGADAWWSVLQQAQKAAEQAASQASSQAAARTGTDSGGPGKK